MVQPYGISNVDELYPLQRCPVCNKSTRDMLQHLIVHQRASEEYLCASPSSQASSSLSRSMSTVSALMSDPGSGGHCIHCT